MYDKQALLNGIEKIKQNILVFEQAIEAERERIREYYRIIDDLDRRARVPKVIVLEAREDDNP